MSTATNAGDFALSAPIGGKHYITKAQVLLPKLSDATFMAPCIAQKLYTEQSEMAYRHPPCRCTLALSSAACRGAATGRRGCHIPFAWRVCFTMMGLLLLSNKQTVKPLSNGILYSTDSNWGLARQFLLCNGPAGGTFTGSPSAVFPLVIDL